MPAAYGLNSCAAHDLATPYCQPGPDGKPPPSWCYSNWCYVDPEACMSLTSASLYFAHADIVLFYSYATCNPTVTTKASRPRSLASGARR